MSGLHHPTESIHVLHVGKMRIKLCKGKTTIAKEYYSSSMQVFQIVNAFWFEMILTRNLKIYFHVLLFISFCIFTKQLKELYFDYDD
jgi:hypothetical protein